MILVVIESPFAGDQARNLRYLVACMQDSLNRGEAPFASHGLYPIVLNDDMPAQRRQGMEAGFAWGAKADACIVYSDLGVSPGMWEGIKRAEANGIPVHWRLIPRWEELDRKLAEDIAEDGA